MAMRFRRPSIPIDRARGVAASVIYHSGILRAVETAAILAEHLAPPLGVEEHAGLSPEDDPAIAKAELETAGHSILVVGHLPHLNRLAAVLMTGDPNRAAADFAPASMMCFEWDRGRWQLAWKSL
jgi:phosphohistidine phosphatase